MGIYAISTDGYSKKTIELVIYVCDKLQNNKNYGAILLNKALCAVDFTHYLKYGNPISDFSYIKQNLGFTPNPAQFLSLRDALIANSDLEKKEVLYFELIQHKYIAKRKPDLNVFSKDEIYLIDNVLDKIKDFSGTDISNYTHSFPAWECAQDMEEIPLYALLIRQVEPSPKAIERANEIVKKYEANKD